MTYEEAVDWVKAKVDEILGNTIYLSGASAKEGGAGIMEQDSLGASVSTRVSFENYQRMAHDAAPNIQMLGVQNLRVHKKQLDLKEIDDAYRAIKAEYDRQYQEGLVPELPELKKYNTIWNVEGNLGVSSIGYDFDKDRKLPVALIGPSLTETALVGAGLTKGRDFTELYLPHKRERTGYNFSLAAINRLVESGVLEDKKYAKLIDAITQVMPTWTRYRPDSASQKIEKQAGVAGVEQGFVDFGKKKLNWVWAASKGRIVISGKSYGLFERITFDQVKYSPSLKEKWFDWNWDASTETVWFYVSEADKAANNVESRAPNFAKTLRESYKTWINFDPELPNTNTPEKGVFCCYGVAATYQWKDGFLIILGFWSVINPLRVDLERANIRVTFEKKTDKNTGKSVPLVYIAKSDLLKVSSFTAGLKRLISTYLPVWDKQGISSGIPGLTGDANSGQIVYQGRKLTYTWNKPDFRIEIRGNTSGLLDNGARELGAQWMRDGSGGYLSIPTILVEKVASTLPSGISDVLRMYEGVWTAEKSSLNQDRSGGSAEGGKWKSTFPEAFMKLSPANEKDFRSTLAWAAKIEKPEGGFIANMKGSDLIIPLSRLHEFIEKADQVGHPEYKQEFTNLIKKWQVKPEIRRGTLGDVAWSFSVPNGTIQVWVADIKGLQSRVGGKMDATGGWHLQVSTKNIIPLVKALEGLYPRLAEAMGRAFGLAAGAVDEDEVRHCAALSALSRAIDEERGAVNYTDITDPEAIRQVEETRAHLAKAFPPGKSPYPFQIIGITYAKMTGYRCLIADMPGLGKTIQGIGCLALNPDQLLPALIVAPANVTYNWKREIETWLPHIKVQVLDSGSTPLPDKAFRGVVIASWEIMRSRVGQLLEWGFSFVIADEAHKAKNWKAAASASLRLLVVGTEGKKPENAPVEHPVPHVLLLTGTPMKNAVSELHPLLSMINTGTWGDRKYFASQYEGEVLVEDSEGTHTRKSTVNVEKLRLQLGCTMIRRRKADALPDLPPKVRTTVYVPMQPQQAEEYYFAKKEFDSWLETSIKNQLVKMGIDPDRATSEARTSAEKSLKAKIIVQIGKLREMIARYKINAAIRLGRRLAAKGESFLYFCDHKSVVDALKSALTAAGVKYGVIDGGTDPKDRAKLAVEFQEGRIQALICTQAAKEGLTLTRAATNIFIERFWTPADEQQAEDRVHRIGQKRPVSIVFLQVPNTIDDYMAALVDYKRGEIDKTLGDEDAEDKAVNEAQELLIQQMQNATASTPEKLIKQLFDRLPTVQPALVEWADRNRRALVRLVYAAVQGELPENEEEVIGQIEDRLRKNPRPRGF